MTPFSIPAPNDRFAADTVRAYLGWALILTFAGLTVWTRTWLPMNSDTSWLITVSEQLLAGKKLYIDVAETNPPASVWLYLPVVALARFGGISPELAVIAAVLLVLVVSLGLSGVVLARSGWLRRFDTRLLVAVCLFLFGVLPGEAFSEREHIAAMLCLPFLAVTVARANGSIPTWPLSLTAGLCAGIVAIIKPHFVLALELPVLLAVLANRHWHMLFSTENVIAGILALCYVGLTFAFYPEFWALAMPINTLLYLPAVSQQTVFDSPILPLQAAVLLASRYFCGPAFWRHPSAMALASALGFCVIFFFQGKFWPYHFYPALALTVLGGFLAALDGRGQREDEVSRPVPFAGIVRLLSHPVVLALVMLALFGRIFFEVPDINRLAARIVQIQTHPVMGNLSGNLGLAHPLVRMIDGRWGMTQHSSWVSENGFMLRQKDQFDPSIVDAAVKRDLDILMADLRRNKPDILVAFRKDNQMLAYMRGFPGVAEELDRYMLVDSVQIVDGQNILVDILQRRDLKTSIHP